MFLIVLMIRVLRLFYGRLVKPLIGIIFRIYYRNIDKVKPLPPIKSPLLLMTAQQLAMKIRSKKITCKEVIDAYIDRIKEVEPLINCTVAECFDEALKEAQHVDYILLSDELPDEYNEENKPLLGVPFTCKETIFVKGMSNSAGCLFRRHVRATEDANSVKNMRNAGAILLAITNTSEFCMWIESRNLNSGISRNPYNLSRLVGGSSGGEGGLLGSAGSLIGIGSDVAGSIRIPAFFNGIYGHKPTPGIVNNTKCFPQPVGIYKEKLSCTGPMCRYATDLRILFKIQADKEPYAEIADKMESKVDLKSLNYYVLTDLGDCLYVSDQSEECKNALEKAVKFIESSTGVKVKKIEINDLKYALMMWSSLANNGQTNVNSFNNLIQATCNQPFNPFVELFKSALGKSKFSMSLLFYAMFEKLPKSDPTRFIDMRNRICKTLDETLGENSVILAPSFPVVAPYHSQPVLTNTIDAAYFFIWNTFYLPVTQVPMGLCNKSGLPLGIQIVANKKCDHLTISIAEHFEKYLVGWIQP